MTTACIVQARMGSNRFPGKVMADLCGKPVIWHVLTRCLQIEGVDKVVLATASDDDRNMALVNQAKLLGCPAFGAEPEDDVLGRYLGAARAVQADIIIRVTADCPLIDPKLCADVLDLVAREKVDYASNSHPTRTFEMGLDCEVFNRRTLEETAQRALDAYDREHVTPFMQRTASFMKGAITSDDPMRAKVNYCIDYPEDLPRVAAFMEAQNAAG